MRKPVFGGLQTTKAQTSLRIRAVRSASLIFAFLKVLYLNLLRMKFRFKLVSVAEPACLNLTSSETPKTGFLAMWPILFCRQLKIKKLVWK